MTSTWWYKSLPLIFIILFLTACGQQAPTTPPAQARTQISTQPGIVAITSPTTYLTSTPEPPVVSPTASIQVIGVDNAAELSIRYRLGKGTIWAPPLYSPDGSFLVVFSTTGAHFYDAHTLHEISTFPTQGWAELAAFSPHGDMLVTGSHLQISLYALPSGVVVRDFQVGAEGRYLMDLACSPDGSQLVAGFGDGLFRLWSIATGELLYTGDGNQLSYSPDGSLLAAVVSGYDSIGKIFVYEASTGTLLREWDGQRASFTSDGMFFVEADGAIRVIDPSTWKAPRAFSGSQAAISPDGTVLALAFQNTVQIWDYASQSKLQVLEGNYGIIQDLQFSPDGKVLAGAVNLFDCCVSGPDTTVLWNIEDGQVITSTMQDYLYPGSFSPDGSAFVTGGRFGINLLDPSSGELIGALDDYASPAAGVAFSPNGELLAAAFGEPRFTVRIWHTSTADPVQTLLDEGSNSGAYTYLDLAFSPDGVFMALRGDLWQISNAKQLQELQRLMSEDHSFWASSIAFQPGSSDILATGSFDGYLALWDVDTDALLGKLQGARGEVIDLDYSQDGNLLAAVTGYPEYKVHLWTMPEGQLSLSLEGESENYVGVAVAPDGQSFATLTRLDDISRGGYVRLWRTSDGQMLLQTDTDDVTSMAFSPDGELMALGSETGSLRLLLVQDGSLLAEFSAQVGLISGVAFSPNGDLLATSSSDGTVVLWGLRP